MPFGKVGPLNVVSGPLQRNKDKYRLENNATAGTLKPTAAYPVSQYVRKKLSAPRG
jgi:hypothetical protein